MYHIIATTAIKNILRNDQRRCIQTENLDVIYSWTTPEKPHLEETKSPASLTFFFPFSSPHPTKHQTNHQHIQQCQNKTKPTLPSSSLSSAVPLRRLSLYLLLVFALSLPFRRHSHL